LPDTFVDFKLIKQQVSMEAALGHYNIRLRRVNQHSLRGLCPLPTHSSEKSAESFGVHTGKNIWACQSSSCAAARAGKKGGNVLDFVSVMENISIRDAALRLHEWFGASSSSAGSTPEKKVEVERSTGAEKKLVAEKKEGSGEHVENKPLTFTLKDVDSKHQYLRSRGIKEETAQHFRCRIFSRRRIDERTRGHSNSQQQGRARGVRRAGARCNRTEVQVASGLSQIDRAVQRSPSARTFSRFGDHR
jgi:DNA primase